MRAKRRRPEKYNGSGSGIWAPIVAESKEINIEASKESDRLASKIDKLTDLVVKNKVA